jgi:hypothetical protein
MTSLLDTDWIRLRALLWSGRADISWNEVLGMALDQSGAPMLDAADPIMQTVRVVAR